MLETYCCVRLIIIFYSSYIISLQSTIFTTLSYRSLRRRIIVPMDRLLDINWKVLNIFLCLINRLDYDMKKSHEISIN